MPFGTWEWIMVLILTGAILYFLYSVAKIIVNRMDENKNESIIISLVRSKGKVTLDDIIIHLHLNPSQASKIMQNLVADKVVKITEEEGRTFYTLA